MSSNLTSAFEACRNFINDLSSEFGKKQKSLLLYDRLITNTEISYVKAVEKHTEIFKRFCERNQDGIREMSISKMIELKIEYSDRIFVDLAPIFSVASEDSKENIWRHLINIGNRCVSNVNFGKLTENKDNENNENNENNDSNANEDVNLEDLSFLTDMASKFEGKINPELSPMDNITALMGSGALNELMAGFQANIGSKNMDFPKIMRTIRNLIRNIEKKNPNMDEEAKKTIGILLNVINSIDNGQEQPDVSAILMSLTGMLGNMGSLGNMGVEGLDIIKLLEK